MRSLGNAFEDRAARLLKTKGLALLARNFRGKPGEIDIIAREGNQLVFVEVRFRSHYRFAGAAASINTQKQQRIIRTAQLFLQQHPRFATMPCRFDVIAFEPPQSGGSWRARWIRAAFTA
ncbi:MAG: YraN family protein [Halioglobus sp.]|nr:YraN family protein [Halioglobus sp.]